jgi:hypothetical protein
MPLIRQLSGFPSPLWRDKSGRVGLVASRFRERGVNMIRTIVLLAVVVLAQPLMAQQEAVNPYKIVLGNNGPCIV